MSENNNTSVSNGIKSVIEALLFSSERPLTIEQLKKVIDNLETKELAKDIEELKSEYEKTNRGLRIIEVAGGFQMITAPYVSVFLKRLYKERRLERLSKPGLETLSIIAYKQPITKLQIQSLRSVNIDGVMKNLLTKGLIRISGRKKVPGRPYVFGTTKQFLEYFGLSSLEELPKMEEFSNFAQQKETEEGLKQIKQINKENEEIEEIPEGTDESKKPAQED